VHRVECTDAKCTDVVRTFPSASRRPAGPLAPPTRRARLRSRWRSRYGGDRRRSAGAKAQTSGCHKIYSGRQRSGQAATMLPLSKLSGSGRTCQKRAFGVGFADLRLLTDPARSPGVRSHREHGQERPGSISGHQKCLQAV